MVKTYVLNSCFLLIFRNILFNACHVLLILKQILFYEEYFGVAPLQAVGSHISK